MCLLFAYVNLNKISLHQTTKRYDETSTEGKSTRFHAA